MVQYNAGDCVVASSFVCDVTAWPAGDADHWRRSSLPQQAHDHTRDTLRYGSTVQEGRKNRGHCTPQADRNMFLDCPRPRHGRRSDGRASSECLGCRRALNAHVNDSHYKYCFFYHIHNVGPFGLAAKSLPGDGSALAQVQTRASVGCAG